MLRCRDEIYLSKEVTKHLVDEWELWGNPFMISMDMENGWFCQAVVRFDPSGHSVVGKVETAAGYSVQVPETPGQEFEYKPIVRIARSFTGRICTCEKRDGDNPDCLVHHPVLCSCRDLQGDDPQCRVHGGGLAS